MKVLIVVDMQNDFIDGSLGTKEAVGIVERVAEVMDAFDGAVICTRDTHFAGLSGNIRGQKTSGGTLYRRNEWVILCRKKSRKWRRKNRPW